MPTSNFNLPLIDGSSPISIVNDMNSLATAADSAMATLASASDIASVRQVATNAATTANEANTAAQTAQGTAGAANTAAVAAQSTATTANNTANAAQATANNALALGKQANTYSKTVINANNANTNGVLNVTANIIDTKTTDGFFVYEFGTFFFIACRGIIVPYAEINQTLGTFVPQQKIDSSLTYVAFGGMGEGSLSTIMAIERTGVNDIRLVGRATESGGDGRRSGWIVLPKVI